MLTDFDYYEIMHEVCERCHLNNGDCPERCGEDCDISVFCLELVERGK